MCLIAFAWHQHDSFPLLLTANRDEFYDRPALPAHFWEDHPTVYAGRDLKEGGSWLGVNRNGRFAAITNIRNPAAFNPNAKSRGMLVSNFLTLDTPVQDYCETLLQQGLEYNGFNLIVGDQNELVYCSNGSNTARKLSPGIYTLSNADLDTSWPKTRMAQRQMQRWLQQPQSAKQLAELLNSREVAADHELPNTGISHDMEKLLSSQFIQTENYGTRCSTGISIDSFGNLEFYEQSYEKGRSGEARHQVIDILTEKLT